MTIEDDKIEQQEAVEEKAEVKQEEKPIEKQTMVPHQALHEQRMMNKQLQEELRASRETQQRMDSTFQKLLGSLNEKPMPKFDDDPLGHMSARNETLEKELRQVNEKIDGFTKQSGQMQFVSQMNEQISSSEAEFRTSQPDYDAALKYLKDVTRSDLADQGMGAADIEQALQQGKLGLAHAALSQGKNPAQIIYERAKRYGYKGQAASTEDRITTLAKGQSMSKTVQGGSSAGLSLRDLAQLPDDQIDDIVSDEKKFQALIRGGIVR
ncbi:MAG: hypothetical protein L0312_19625 [Acidobacteria bacterium]|nr:hypothetical protein [Acidobacteriota bacterium]